MRVVTFPARDAKGEVQLLRIEVDNDIANLFPVVRLLGWKVSDLKSFGFTTARGTVQVPIKQVTAFMQRLRKRGAAIVLWQHCCEHLEATLAQPEAVPVVVVAPEVRCEPPQPAPAVELILNPLNPEQHLRRDLSLLRATPEQINTVIGLDSLPLSQTVMPIVVPGFCSPKTIVPSEQTLVWHQLRDSYVPGALRDRSDLSLKLAATAR